MVRVLLLVLTALLLPSTARCEPPSLAPVFQDSMVLQRGMPVPVWGRTQAGVAVTVTFAEQRKATKADDEGNWRVTLNSLAADADPHDLKVIAGEDTLIVRDILVGEIWVAAGQSNMEWPLANDAHAKAELPTADHPTIRLFNLNYVGQNFFAKPFGPDVLRRLTPHGFYRGAWQPCTRTSAKDFSAVGYYFAKEIHQTVKVPVGVIHLAVGGSPTEAWIRREAMAGDRDLAPLLKGDWLENENQEAWCRQRGRENLAVALKEKVAQPKDQSGPNHPFKPGFLWDAGIARLMPFPIRGVIWYQGESNSLELRRVRQHERLFPMLVADWRKQWGIGEFPFLYCQLSSIGTEKGYKSQHWPEFRDSQRRMFAEIPNTGMAVTSDVGHPTDVHPRDKQTVARRLTRAALAIAYQQPGEYSGPLPVKAELIDGAVRVQFAHITGSLSTSDAKPAASFEVAGADRAFHSANAELRDRSVLLRCEAVANARFVRYGWQPYSLGNLIDSARLPASTFEIPVPAVD